ncbi:MAG: hypothetical protein ABIN89_22265 [Chitinophagaceae bacterium]
MKKYQNPLFLFIPFAKRMRARKNIDSLFTIPGFSIAAPTQKGIAPGKRH